jgi:hypothetical protein
MARRLVWSVLLACLCVSALGTSAFVEFERVRVRVVKTPVLAEHPTLALTLPDLSRFGGQPTAFILRLAAPAEQADVQASLDGVPVGRIRVPAQRDIRFDTFILPPSGAGHQLTLSADRAGWKLVYLEIATVHGYSLGLLSFVIIPAGRVHDAVAPLWLLLVLLAALIALRPRPDWPAAKPVRRLYHAGVTIAVLLLLLSLLSGVFTNYKVLLSLHTLVLCVALLYIEPVTRLWPPIRARLDRLHVETLAPLPSWREMLLAFGAFALLIAIVLHAQVTHPGSVPDMGDPLFSIWRLSWVTHQLPGDPRHLFDANIFYPARGSLTYSDSVILPSLMAMPLLWIGIHPVVVYSLVLLSAFALSGLFTYVLARSFGLGVPAAWTSGVMFSLYPYRFEHYPHMELQMAQWMPLVLLGAHRLMLGGRRNRSLALMTVALAAQWYSSMYYGLFLSVFVSAFGAAIAVVYKTWRRLAWVAAGVVLGTILAAPLARAYSEFLEDRGGNRPLEAITAFSATPKDYLEPHERSALYGGLRWGEPVSERQLFPGVAPIVLGIAGAWPPLGATRLAVLTAGVVAFDGSLGVHGAWYPLAYRLLSPFQSIRVPARFALLVGLALALLSGFAVERWQPRLRSVPVVWLAAGLTIPLVVDARPTLDLVPVWRDPPPIYGALNGSSTAVLMEYPLNTTPADFVENIPFMYFSIWHWTPMINGYSGHIPPAYAKVLETLEGFPAGHTLLRLQQVGVTHISVVCALEGGFGPHGVPVSDVDKCNKTIEQLDADPRLNAIVRATWNGAPALLYEFRQ